MIETFVFRLLFATVFLVGFYPIVWIVLKCARARSAVVHRTCWGGLLLVSLIAASVPVEIPTPGTAGILPTSETIEPETVVPLENDFPLVAKPPIPVAFSPPIHESQSMTPPPPVAVESFPIIEPVNKITPPQLPISNFPFPISCIFLLVSLAWFSGVLYLLSNRLLLHLKLRKIWNRGERAAPPNCWTELLKKHRIPEGRIPVYLTDSIGPALVQSFFSRRLLIPRSVWEDLPDELKIGVLRHELAHYLHGDTALSPLVYFLAVVQWFNPLAWPALRRYDTATEWYCDEFAYGDGACGSVVLAETFLTIHRSSETLGLYLNTFSKFSTLDRIDRLAANETLGKEHVMKKAFILVAVFTLLLCGVMRPRFVAWAQQDTTPSQRERPSSEKEDIAYYELRVLQAEKDLAVTKAGALRTIEIDYAKAALAVAEAEVDKVEQLNKNQANTVSHMEVLRTKLRRVQAKKQLEKATFEHDTRLPILVQLKENELQYAQAMLAEKRDGKNPETNKSPEAYQVERAKLELKLAEAETASLADVEYAKAAWTVAIAQVDENRQMNKKVPNTISEQAFLEDNLEKIQAQKQYENAVFTVSTQGPLIVEKKKIELKIAEARLAEVQGVSKKETQKTIDKLEADRAETALKLAEASKILAALGIEYAKSVYHVAQAKVDRDKRMNESVPNTVSEQMVLEAEAELLHAKAAWEKAKYEHDTIIPAEIEVKKRELEIAKSRAEKSREPEPWEKPPVRCGLLVRNPDGKPAVGAELLCPLVSDTMFPIRNNKPYMFRGPITEIPQADSDGKLAFDLRWDDKDILLTHPDGALFVFVKDVQWSETSETSQTATVRLQPWGKIVGAAKKANRELPNVEMDCDVNFKMPNSHSIYVLKYRTTTDERGRFAFDQVVPGGHVRIQRAAPGSSIGDSNNTEGPIYFDLAPGETKTVQFGGVGRPVIGKLRNVNPATLAELSDWSHSSIQLRRIDKDQPVPEFTNIPIPKNVDKSDLAAVSAWFPKWSQTEEAKQFWQVHEQFYKSGDYVHWTASLDREGNFRFDEIRAGRYHVMPFCGRQFSDQYYQVLAEPVWMSPTIVEITVPDNITWTSEPQDLGTLDFDLMDPSPELTKEYRTQ